MEGDSRELLPRSHKSSTPAGVMRHVTNDGDHVRYVLPSPNSNDRRLFTIHYLPYYRESKQHSCRSNRIAYPSIIVFFRAFTVLQQYCCMCQLYYCFLFLVRSVASARVSCDLYRSGVLLRLAVVRYRQRLILLLETAGLQKNNTTNEQVAF